MGRTALLGIGAHVSERVLSLVIGGNQPYAWPNSALVRTITGALAEGARSGSMEPLVRAFEDFWEIQLPEVQRRRLLNNDPVALRAAWSAAQSEGAIFGELGGGGCAA
jgi:xanthosine utilization system XapX-like protein